MTTRRDFLAGLAAGAARAALPARRSAGLRVGYAAITWGGNDRQAIADIAEVGFRGIQLRASAVQSFGQRPAELRALLDRHRLTMVALSSGTLRLDPAA